MSAVMQEAHDVFANIVDDPKRGAPLARLTPAGIVRTELMWAVHNLIAHPFSEITHWLGYVVPGLRDFGLWVHDITVPPHAPNTGRG